MMGGYARRRKCSNIKYPYIFSFHVILLYLAEIVLIIRVPLIVYIYLIIIYNN